MKPLLLPVRTRRTTLPHCANHRTSVGEGIQHFAPYMQTAIAVDAGTGADDAGKALTSM
jgi:hypothetical protein